MPLSGASHQYDNSLPSQHVMTATTIVKMNDTRLHSGVMGAHSTNSQQHLDEDGDVFHPLTIKLIDHTAVPSENSPGIWARSAKVVDYVIVSGSRTRAGAYVAWNCSIETFEGAQFIVRKRFLIRENRYSEFDDLRERLIETFPRSRVSIPTLPPKSVVSKFRPKFLEARRQGLSYFLSCILLNPEFAGSPLVKEFLLRADE